MRVFITGASSGIGAALARHYAATGATLGLAARREDKLKALAAMAGGDQHRVYPLDVADAEAVSAAANDFMERLGTPHIVIANAGVSVGTSLLHPEDAAATRRVLETNVLGVVHSLQPFVAPMRAAGDGRLVGVASLAGLRGLPGAGAYCASKAAVIACLESLRVDLHGSGVKVVTLAPGYIETPMTAGNPYPMPFLTPVDAAARSMARAIARGASFAVTPWQMAVVATLLKLTPRFLFDVLAARAGRKPRGLPL